MTARTERRGTAVEEAAAHLAAIRLLHDHTLDRVDREAIAIVLRELAQRGGELAAANELHESDEALRSRDLVVALRRRAGRR